MLISFYFGRSRVRSVLIKEQLPCQAELLHNAALPFRRQCMIPIGLRRVQLLMKLCSCPAPQIMHVGRSNKHRPSLSSTKLYIRTPPAAQTTDVFWRNRDITRPSHWQGMLFGALFFALFRFCLPCFFWCVRLESCSLVAATQVAGDPSTAERTPVLSVSNPKRSPLFVLVFSLQTSKP